MAVNFEKYIQRGSLFLLSSVVNLSLALATQGQIPVEVSQSQSGVGSVYTFPNGLVISSEPRVFGQSLTELEAKDPRLVDLNHMMTVSFELAMSLSENPNALRIFDPSLFIEDLFSDFLGPFYFTRQWHETYLRIGPELADQLVDQFKAIPPGSALDERLQNLVDFTKNVSNLTLDGIVKSDSTEQKVVDTIRLVLGAVAGYSKDLLAHYSKEHLGHKIPLATNEDAFRGPEDLEGFPVESEDPVSSVDLENLDNEERVQLSDEERWMPNPGFPEERGPETLILGPENFEEEVSEHSGVFDSHDQAPAVAIFDLLEVSVTDFIMDNKEILGSAILMAMAVPIVGTLGSSLIGASLFIGWTTR